MSNAIFPSLPGISIESVKSPVWKTGGSRSASGMASRVSWMSYPNWRLRLSFEVLRAGAEAELQSLVGFFNQRGGRFENFLYLDSDDNSVTDQAFDTGDGATVTFRLGRTYGGAFEPISATTGAITLKVNGATKTAGVDYTLDQYTGKVTFAVAPANGAVLTWTGGYYWRVCFERDQADFKRFLKDLWESKQVDLITDKTA